MPQKKQQKPRHVAIIMDGNGRHAKKRGLPRREGHAAGAETVRTVVEAAARHRVETLTLYAFSSDNWNRPLDEVRGIFDILRHSVSRYKDEMHQKNVRIQCVGNLRILPIDLQHTISAIERLTATNTGINVRIAISYGAHDDIMQAVRQLAVEVAEGEISPHRLSKTDLEKRMWTNGKPVDLLIRPGGEQRLSEFLLWEMAYTELYFTKTLWPDFGERDLEQAFAWFGQRDRRYGRIKEEVSAE